MTEADTYTPEFPFSDTAIRYQVKVLKAGQRYTTKRYLRPIYVHRKGIIRPHHIKPTRSTKLELTNDKQYKRRLDNINRAKQRFENTVHSNYPLVPQRYLAPVEVTTTYAVAELSRDQALKDFRKFIRNMNNVYGTPDRLKWVAVAERQKERGLKENNAGSWHFHIVFFNLGFNDRTIIQDAWGKGRTHIKRKSFGYDGAKSASYLSKYFVKDAHEVKRNKKMYQVSRDLDKPTEYIRPFIVKNVLKDLYDNHYIKSFEKTYPLPATDNAVITTLWEPPKQKHPLAESVFVAGIATH